MQDLSSSHNMIKERAIQHERFIFETQECPFTVRNTRYEELYTEEERRIKHHNIHSENKEKFDANKIFKREIAKGNNFTGGTEEFIMSSRSQLNLYKRFCDSEEYGHTIFCASYLGGVLTAYYFTFCLSLVIFDAFLYICGVTNFPASSISPRAARLANRFFIERSLNLLSRFRWYSKKKKDEDEEIVKLEKIKIDDKKDNIKSDLRNAISDFADNHGDKGLVTVSLTALKKNGRKYSSKLLKEAITEWIAENNERVLDHYIPSSAFSAPKISFSNNNIKNGQKQECDLNIQEAKYQNDELKNRNNSDNSTEEKIPVLILKSSSKQNENKPKFKIQKSKGMKRKTSLMEEIRKKGQNKKQKFNIDRNMENQENIML